MALTNGTRLGPYEILSPIGAGAMGEVYRARDTRLGRDVALKILPATLASEGSDANENDRLHRFEQESRKSPPQPPQYSCTPFLVSELLEGESVRAVLDEGALTQRKTIEYGVQIAHGLAPAHDKGIVHRDLKPENLFLTKDGRVKILDFRFGKAGRRTRRR